MVAAAVVAAGVVGAVASSDASRRASNTQADAAKAGQAVQNTQFDAVQKLLLPYVQAGTGVDDQGGSLQAQQALAGLGAPGSQQAAIDAIRNGPEFQSLLQAGNNNILQNASATGGLRGGNTQAALGQFSPQLLSSLIDSQYSRLGGLTSIGQNAAAGTGNAGMQTGNNIAALMQQAGAAQAGGILGQSAAINGGLNSAVQGYGLYRGMNTGIGATAQPSTSNEMSDFYGAPRGTF